MQANKQANKQMPDWLWDQLRGECKCWTVVDRLEWLLAAGGQPYQVVAQVDLGCIRAIVRGVVGEELMGQRSESMLGLATGYPTVIIRRGDGLTGILLVGG